MSQYTITKYEHACLILEKDGKKLIIDPGSFTNLPEDVTGVSCLIVTEEHMDHYQLKNIKKITEANGGIAIFSTEAVAKLLEAEGIKTVAISGKQTKSVDGFSLIFWETDHAPTYKNSPCRSMPVKVDEFLYYPSDTYYVIPDSVEVVALPTSGPWFKVEESIDFANQLHSPILLATHNALNSSIGNNVTHHFIEMNLSDSTRKLQLLEVGESLVI